jgi:uncharacterized protein
VTRDAWHASARAGVTAEPGDTPDTLTSGGVVAIRYIGAIAVAEALLVFVSVLIGVVGHTVLIAGLAAHCLIVGDAPRRRILLALALLPLLRILSLAMPVEEAPRLAWYALVGAPVLLGAVLVTRIEGLSLRDVGLGVPRRPLIQVLVAVSGVPIGALVTVLRTPSFTDPSVSQPILAAAAAVAVAVFAGFTEELVFRGLLLTALREVLGAFAVPATAIGYAALYVGSLSLEYTVFAAVMGLLYGWIAYRTRSIWGVATAHGVSISTGLFMWPGIIE